MPLTSPSTVLLRTQSDERLLTLARAGHERAFEAIVERYRRPLLRASRHVLPEARAEDALQHALVAAWTALRRGDEVRELRPWLYRIVHNTALNQLRVSGYDYAELREALVAREAPQDELERRAVVRQTLTGLAALPERQRAALLQIAVAGRAQEDVARQLGISEGAVRQLVHRARVTLRAAATAVVPLPLANWAAAASTGGLGAADRIGEAVGAGLLAKAGAVMLLAGGAVAGPVLVAAEPAHRPASRSAPSSGTEGRAARDSAVAAAAAGLAPAVDHGRPHGAAAPDGTARGAGFAGSGARGRERGGARSGEDGGRRAGRGGSDGGGSGDGSGSGGGGSGDGGGSPTPSAGESPAPSSRSGDDGSRRGGGPGGGGATPSGGESAAPSDGSDGDGASGRSADGGGPSDASDPGPSDTSGATRDATSGAGGGGSYDSGSSDSESSGSGSPNSSASDH